MARRSEAKQEGDSYEEEARSTAALTPDEAAQIATATASGSEAGADASRVPTTATAKHKCRGCAHRRDEVSPQDDGDVRAWSSTDGDMCAWCEELWSIMAHDGLTKDPEQNSTEAEYLAWRWLLASFFCIGIEGGHRTAASIRIRAKTMKACMPGCVTFTAKDLPTVGAGHDMPKQVRRASSDLSSTRSHTGSAAGTESFSPPSVASPSMSRKRSFADAPDDAPAGATPTSKAPTASRSSGGSVGFPSPASVSRPRGRGEALAGSVRGGSAHPGARGSTTPVKREPGATPVKAEEHDDADDSDGGSVVDRADIGGMIPITAASVDLKLTGGTLANSMSRTRTTINQYTQRMSELSWYTEVRWSTLKALERRLLNNAVAVDESTNMHLADAFDELRQRVKALLAAHKCISKWSNGYAEEKLVDILPPLHILANFLQIDGLEFGSSLKIIRQRALVINTVMQYNQVAVAARHIDMKGLQAWVTEVQDNAENLTVKEAKPVVKKAKKSTDDLTHPAPAVSKHPAVVIIEGHTALSYAQALVDGVLQRRLTAVTRDEGKLAAEALAIADDFDKLSERTDLAEGNDKDEFLTMIRSLAIIFRCAAADAGLANMPPPSSVIEARQAVDVLGTRQDKPMLACKAMLRYPHLKPIMQIARRRCAVGRGDTCGDNEFQEVVDLVGRTFKRFAGEREYEVRRHAFNRLIPPGFVEHVCKNGGFRDLRAEWGNRDEFRVGEIAAMPGGGHEVLMRSEKHELSLFV